VNRADLLQRRGRYPVPPGFPEDILGMEFSGTVLELSAGCGSRRVGDQVMGILGGGGYSEEIVIPEAETIRIPSVLAGHVAGGIPEVFITAWDALARQAHLAPGETVLIHAVGSGVGTAALQLALAIGCRTIGTSRNQWKLDRAGEMGLHHGVLVRGGRDAGNWVSAIETILSEESSSGTALGRVDVLFDLVGGAYFEGNLQVIGERGRWIVVGLTSGSQAAFDLRAFIAKRATLIGTVLRARSREEKVALASEFEREIVPLFERGELRPIVDRTFPAEQASEAHRCLEGGDTFGKVLLSWDFPYPDIDPRPEVNPYSEFRP
jgi:NADPH:quinone reductase-like Zn-dependent oxidoreductase